MKVAFVFQYYPYQYEQFKDLVEYCKSDAFYRTRTDSRSERCPNTVIYEAVTGKPVTLEDFVQGYYDCLVYTGTWCTSLIKFAEKCKYKNVVLISHSLIGSLYDISIVTTTEERGVGLVPKNWTEFSSFKKRMRIIEDMNLSTNILLTTTHPMVNGVISRKPRVNIEPNTLGVIFGEKSPFDHFSKIVDDLIERFNISKVKIKFHPLNYGREDLIEMFSSDTRGYNIEILPIDYDKYDWTDSCEYIIGGCSSLLIESILRSTFYNKNQKFKQFPFPRRGIPLSIESYDSSEWSLDAPEFTASWIFSGKNSNEELQDTLEILIRGAKYET